VLLTGETTTSPAILHSRTFLINQFTTFYVFLRLIDTLPVPFDYVGCRLSRNVSRLRADIRNSA